MATWEDVRQLALAFPEVAERPSYGGKPALRVRGKWFAGMSPHEEGALVVRCDPDERSLIVASRPDVFYLTPHYERSDGYVLVRLAAVDAGELSERLEDAWLLAAPKRLAEQLADEGHAGGA